ncbi:protein VTE6, chloroplastic [Syzygium oleosum]|uniref:protein VTE6, chloroplastic n=1 Tax=Syzygium oleosum TaxID=219896 RepID=UPI0011D237F7|nr:protein VTE6, chloroplastic [Syzygium oleosum]
MSGSNSTVSIRVASSLRRHSKRPKMSSLSTLLLLNYKPPPIPPSRFFLLPSPTLQKPPPPPLLLLLPNHLRRKPRLSRPVAALPDAMSAQGALSEALALIQSAPPTWKSAVFSNLLIFVAGSPILVAGLSAYGIGAAFLLGTLTWRAFGPSGFLLVAAYFVIGTAATKVKMAQKEAQGVAEKRKGRRGPGSVIGSSAAGCVCAFLSIFGIGGKAFSHLWLLGFIASFCTKLSDTVSSEIGKAYGKTTYLVTTFKIVPRGTEGAVSLEGTIAGIVVSVLLALASFLLGQIKAPEAVICVVASQIANLGESIIGAAFQEKEGFRWLNNDAVNIINISMGSILAVLMQQVIVPNL